MDEVKMGPQIGPSLAHDAALRVEDPKSLDQIEAELAQCEPHVREEVRRQIHGSLGRLSLQMAGIPSHNLGAIGHEIRRAFLYMARLLVAREGGAA
ncbi:MAG: hypothetical protein AB1486_18675 [Planctomycetota bacterium]